MPCAQHFLLRIPGAIPVEVGVGAPSAPSAALLCPGPQTLMSPSCSPKQPKQGVPPCRQSLAPLPPTPPLPAHVHGVLWDQLTVLSWLVRVPAGLHLLPRHQRFHLRCCHHHRLWAGQGKDVCWHRGTCWVGGPVCAGLSPSCCSRAQSTALKWVSMNKMTPWGGVE